MYFSKFRLAVLCVVLCIWPLTFFGGLFVGVALEADPENVIDEISLKQVVAEENSVPPLGNQDGGTNVVAEPTFIDSLLTKGYIEAQRDTRWDKKLDNRIMLPNGNSVLIYKSTNEYGYWNVSFPRAHDAEGGIYHWYDIYWSDKQGNTTLLQQNIYNGDSGKLISFSPFKNYLVISGGREAYSFFKLFEMTQGKLLFTSAGEIEQYDLNAHHVVWSPDEQTIAYVADTHDPVAVGPFLITSHYPFLHHSYARAVDQALSRTNSATDYQDIVFTAPEHIQFTFVEYDTVGSSTLSKYGYDMTSDVLAPL